MTLAPGAEAAAAPTGTACYDCAAQRVISLQRRVVTGQRILHGFRMLLEESRRALDIGEEKGDNAARKSAQDIRLVDRRSGPGGNYVRRCRRRSMASRIPFTVAANTTSRNVTDMITSTL